MPSIRALLKQMFPKSSLVTQKGSSGSAFASYSGKKDTERGGASTQLSTKPKHDDIDDFVPLVDLESVNHSHMDLSTGPHSTTNSSMHRKSVPAMGHEEGQDVKE